MMGSGLQEKFDSSIPQPDRRTMAVKVIAVYAAGREAEILLGRKPDENWSTWDETKSSDSVWQRFGPMRTWNC
jgi:hypothetical protein